MKKILMPFMLLLAVVVISISSCAKEESSASDMIGFYDGTVKTNSALQVSVATINIDTTFTDLAATAEISAHDSDDSLNLEVKLSIDGTPITVKVPAYVSGTNTISITNYKYTYLSFVHMIVNGTGTVDGNELTANLTLAEGTGNPTGTIIGGSLTFNGSKE